MSLYLAVLITAVISCVVGSALGFIWYGPIFGKKYASIMGMDMNDPMKMEQGKKAMPYLMGVNFVIMLFTYYAFNFASALLINPTVIKGILFFSIFIWAGFLMPMAASNALWSGKSPKMSLHLFLITAGFQLAMILVSGLIWTLVYPILL